MARYPEGHFERLIQRQEAEKKAEEAMLFDLVRLLRTDISEADAIQLLRELMTKAKEEEAKVHRQVDFQSP